MSQLMDAVDDVEPSVRVFIPHVRGLAAVLQSIRAGSKQTCSVKIDSCGMEVRWEDESKTLQSLVFLKPEIFSLFSCPSVRKFSLQFSQLLDSLHVFASTNAGMEMSYPGPTGELTFQVLDDSSGIATCTYARISSVESAAVRDLEEFWEEPASYFLTRGALMKEVVDDLEWPGGAVEICMQQQPARLRMSAKGVGSLEAELPVPELSDFMCTEPQVRNSYKYKSLKAAFCNLPHPKEVGSISTKVMMDVNGLLKITHVMSLNHGPAEGGGDSQRGFDSTRLATVHFLVLPQADM